MYRKITMVAKGWLPYDDWLQELAGIAYASPRRFELLRWFAIVSFLAITLFSVAFAMTLSHFLKEEILQRDAILTSQFIHSLAEAQVKYAHLDGLVSLGQILDERANLPGLGVDTVVAEGVRNQFYDHLRVLPDALLATAFAPDHKIIWSTNHDLIGKVDHGNDELESALAAHVTVSTEYDAEEERPKQEQRFKKEPDRFFVENYVPLIGRNGEVTAVIEIYKEPVSLEQTIQRGKKLVWLCVLLGAIFLYFALVWLIRRAEIVVNEQKRRLVEAESLCVIGEMSAAVAHGIRNPLASIRSSAELALDGSLDESRKNAQDIVSQVDRLGNWIRDLLIFSRPVSGEVQTIALDALIEDCLRNYATQFQQGRVDCQFIRPAAPMPRVAGNWALATQALASIIANAIEAMADGGALRLELKPDKARKRVDLVVTDTGQGMTPTQLESVFKPFYTTKRKGLGLGMSLVKRIMERFGGSITLDSRQGEGTRATLGFRMV